jgi:hypothetical protein
MKKAIVTYTWIDPKGNLLIETFDYVDKIQKLTRNGYHVYEYDYDTVLLLNYHRAHLERGLALNDIEYKKEKI